MNTPTYASSLHKEYQDGSRFHGKYGHTCRHPVWLLRLYSWPLGHQCSTRSSCNDVLYKFPKKKVTTTHHANFYKLFLRNLLYFRLRFYSIRVFLPLKSDAHKYKNTQTDILIVCVIYNSNCRISAPQTAELYYFNVVLK